MLLWKGHRLVFCLLCWPEIRSAAASAGPWQRSRKHRKLFHPYAKHLCLDRVTRHEETSSLPAIPAAGVGAWGRRRGFWNPDSSANEEKADWSISSAVTWQQTFNLRCPNFINFLPWSGKQHVKPTSFTRYTSELHQLNIHIYIKLLTPPQPTAVQC